MIPNPLDIPPSLDCVAIPTGGLLPSTGVDVLLPLLVGLVALAAGIVFFALSRGRLRRGSMALGLVLLLAAGGTGLAVTAPASSASADECTPLDYQLNAGLVSPLAISSGGTVEVNFWITNVVDRNGTPPIVVSIPRFAGTGNPTSFHHPGGENGEWKWIDKSNPDFYYFEYSGPLPKGTMSTVATFRFALTTASTGVEQFSFPVSIVTGSGGDTNVKNNTVVLSVEADGTIDFQLDAELTSPSTIDSGDFVELNFAITNVTDVDGTEPVVVSIPRLDGAGGPITFADPGPDFTGWEWIDQSDPDFFYFEYSNLLPAGMLSTVASLSFSLTTADDDLEHFDFPVSILTGSGGDSNVANNTMVLSVDADGTLDYAISGTITPEPGTALSSGATVQINLRVANVLPRDGRGPLVVRIPNQAAFGTFTLGNFSPGWSLTYEEPYYVLTHAAGLLEGEQTSTARLEFTASNGNNSPVDLTIPAAIETGSGGDSNDANNGIVFPLQVNGVVG